MDWLSAHWWQVLLVLSGALALRELREARRDLQQIYQALVRFPQLQDQAEHARWKRERGP